MFFRTGSQTTLTLHIFRRYVLLGEATMTDVDCEDQRKYRIRYACRHRDKEELEVDHRPRRRGMFALRVRGCPRPKPNPRPKPVEY